MSERDITTHFASCQSFPPSRAYLPHISTIIAGRTARYADLRTRNAAPNAHKSNAIAASAPACFCIGVVASLVWGIAFLWGACCGAAASGVTGSGVGSAGAGAGVGAVGSGVGVGVNAYSACV
ncbi:hypothetical protein HMPREF9248_1171 [Fannyhessea vaginae PB189-T1-4]|uniref:Uncharacterized protein n=1 Tax=Fannyhessea vaginae PB189-T1-4 TaxID=866774 RepID=A0ABN0B1C4_9ACTN|nr:hypothetical protein HMPREF9248_1171 [Fannyhessea vaginae PB189-T1-4]